MHRLGQVFLIMIASSTPLVAQRPDPGPDPASGPFLAGVGATILPISAGVALMVGAKGDLDSGSGSAGLLLATGGLLLGPAVGDWAGGLVGRGFAGFGLRTVAWIGGFVTAFAMSWNGNGHSGDAVFLGGLGIASGLAVWDLATLKGAVRRHRARSVSVLPIVRPEAHALGLALHLTF